MTTETRSSAEIAAEQASYPAFAAGLSEDELYSEIELCERVVEAERPWGRSIAYRNWRHGWLKTLKAEFETRGLPELPVF